MKPIVVPLLILLSGVDAAMAQPGGLQTGAREEGPRPPGPAELRSAFAQALQAGQVDDARREADALLARNGGDPSLLDELTYKLVEAGAAGAAAPLLLRAYPFDNASPAQRDALWQRLVLIVDRQPGVVSPDQLQLLRVPLPSPAWRGRQASFWATLRDCDAVRTLLADMSPDYSYEDWLRLGDCASAESQALARQAFARAHVLQPGGRASRALAYLEYSEGDYRTALDAWRSVGDERLVGDDLLAAATTALAAEEPELALQWLERYRTADQALTGRYWSLTGQAQAASDPALAVAALERAVHMRPDVDDYLRLSRLADDANRQLAWLERAAALGSDNASVQQALAYIYLRVGRPWSALTAFERTAALDPDNMHVQIELGYAYWRANEMILAQQAFERAWQADPRNHLLAQQLVYVHQRLSQNEQARWYARKVLDLLGAPGVPDLGNPSLADRRFGFQRLHEDLARRVTVNLDAWSGTQVGAGASALQTGKTFRSYSQLEVDIRLGTPPIRNGSTVSAYARVFGDGGDEQRPVPSENVMLGVGLRWKPWRSQIVYFAVEHQNGVEDRRRRDQLIRASASFLNGGRFGDDWRPTGSDWISQNLYFDAAHYVRADQSAFTADYRTSYHRKLAAKQTLEPYVHLQFSALGLARIERDVRGGAGVRWNIWHGGSQYNADPHKISLGVEFQHAFDTYLSNRQGVFVTLGSRW